MKRPRDQTPDPPDPSPGKSERAVPPAFVLSGSGTGSSASRILRRGGADRAFRAWGTGRDRTRPASANKEDRMPGAERGTPIKDLGPVGAGRSWFDRVCRDPQAYRVVEAVELAAANAERTVRPFLAGRATVPVRGRAAVGLRFLDDSTLSTFERCGALTRRRAWQTRLLVRRWASARGDAQLDEHMAFAVAKHLETEFEGLLQAIVFSWQDRGTRSRAPEE